MPVSPGYKKMKNYLKESGKFKLISRWTNANTVECDDGKTVQSKIGGIDGISSSLDSNNSAQAASTVLTNQLHQNIVSLQSSFQNFQSSFQDGCNLLYNACVSLGVTPSNNSPEAIRNAINSIYNNGIALGQNNVIRNPDYYGVPTLKVGQFSVSNTEGAHQTLYYDTGVTVKYAGIYGFYTNEAGSKTGGGDTCNVAVEWSGTIITIGTWGTNKGTGVSGYYFY